MRRRLWVFLGVFGVTVLLVGHRGLIASRAGLNPEDNVFPAIAARFPGNGLACNADKECRLTGYVDGDCCGDGCGPGEAYNEAFVDALMREVAQRCTHSVCPQYRCVAARPESHEVARCLDGRCKYVSFSWTTARVADVTVVGRHARVRFESNGLPITVRVDGLSYDDPDIVHPLRDGARTRIAEVVSEWSSGHPSGEEALVPGAAEKFAQGNVEWRTSVAKLAIELNDPSLAPAFPTPIAHPASSSCTCAPGDPLCSCL